MFLVTHSNKNASPDTDVTKRLSVELEGVEPSSAQGNHTLSTRLFQTSFSCYGKTWTTNRSLIS